MADLPPVSVVMPARNAAGTIVDAVAAVFAQEYAGGIELIVAAGPSHDQTALLLADQAGDGHPTRVLPNPIGTTPAGLNIAIAAAKGEVIVRCDAHCVLPPRYIAAAVDALERTGADVVGGLQDPIGTTPVERAVAAAMRSRLGSGGAAYRIGRRAGPTDTVYLGVFRRAALDRVGGFDERLIRNQDYELNYRIRATGGIVWLDPTLKVTYRPRRTLGALWKQYFSYGRWKRRVLGMHPASVRVRQFAAPALVVALAGSVALLAFGFSTAAALVPGIYIGSIASAGLLGAVRERDAALLLTPAALATMHVAWGLGFLIGTPKEPGRARGEQ